MGIAKWTPRFASWTPFARDFWRFRPKVEEISLNTIQLNINFKNYCSGNCQPLPSRDSAVATPRGRPRGTRRNSFRCELPDAQIEGAAPRATPYNRIEELS